MSDTDKGLAEKINEILDAKCYPYGDKNLPMWTERESLRVLYGDDIVDALESAVAAALEASRTPPKEREPQPEDGPDYHAEHAAWVARNGTPVTPAEGEAEEAQRKALENVLHPHQSNGMDGDHHLCSCGRLYGQWWKHLAEVAVAAGFARRSPVETEENWEYGLRYLDGINKGRVNRHTEGAARGLAAVAATVELVRRVSAVPAGPWLPVTEEKK